MPIVTIPRCHFGYPLSRIPDSFIARLRTDQRPLAKQQASLIRLQAFLELTDQTLIDADDAEIKDVLGGYVAAHYTDLFSDSGSTQPWAKFTNFLLALPEALKPDALSTTNRLSWELTFRRCVDELEAAEFDPVALEFWQGWIIENAAGERCALRLWRFWNHFGPERTRELLAASSTWFSKSRTSSISPTLSQFSDFLADRGPLDFKDSTSIGTALNEFMHVFFRSGHREGKKIITLSAEWRRFADLLNNHLLGNKWASAIPAIPIPANRKDDGAAAKIKTTSSGHAVKISLITPVPLHVTDSQAKEILFRDIRREVDAITAWARHEVDEARHRLTRRTTLASSGIATEIGAVGTITGVSYRLSRECPDHLAHAAATFEAKQLQHLGSGYSTNRFYPEPLAQTAWELGLPTRQLLLAHATILVREHPKITPAFLTELELFDSNGQQVGLTELDAGWYLRGVKRRRGAALAQQEVLLTAETLQIVRDVVELTAPLRNWLRAQNHPHWRRLFLSMASMGTAPLQWNADNEAYRGTEWMARRLREAASNSQVCERNDLHWLKDPAASLDLATRFSLRRLRASAGVLVYLETGSVEAMAEALGHAKWRPSLMDRYLPRPIQEFFVERWIRLFQNGILCEALRDSPFLLEATEFDSMDELDAFLENHALRRVPKHLESPDISLDPERPEQSQVVFGIEAGILSILMSVEAAVRTSIRPACGRAIRWARISERLVPHLESQIEQPEFHSMVALARRHIDPSRVEALIYA